ncbi:MarR family transcriptional regulator [Paraburkholderia phymatum]|uniref:MarR family winged helix-turn-helix transcriptional regulator n=1 Tax=Paraburkholderia phymatum TaxID=148447 RepID=UPI00317EF6C4
MKTRTQSVQLADSTSQEIMPPFEPMNHPGHLVRRLHQICVAVFLDAARDYDLTHVQFAALLAIERYPDIDQTRMAKLVALDRQTTSNVVARLITKGLVERRQKNKRTSALRITGAGKALIEVMQPRQKPIDDTILGPLTEQERETLMALLRKVVGSNNALSRAPHFSDVEMTAAGGQEPAEDSVSSGRRR